MVDTKLLDKTYKVIQILGLRKMKEASGETNQEVLLVLLKAREGANVSFKVGYFHFFIDVPVLLLKERLQLGVLVGIKNGPWRLGRNSMTG